jgi:ABC-2 type transport system ATP-binding protein
VERGETYGLLGGPLSGKTMVTDLLLGFRRPDAGSVAVLGRDPGVATPRLHKDVSFADGRAALHGPLTPLQNLALLCRLSGAPWVHHDGANALRRMGLPDRHLDRATETLPGPSNLSIMLALAWLRRTPVLVLDEPTHGLDTLAIAVFLESLHDFRSTHTTILLTTSDVLVAAKAADRVGILKRGEKVAERRRSQLLQESLTALYADYVGRVDALAERT